MRWIGALMIAAAAVLAGASAAQAQYPPAQPPTLVVSRDVGPPGYTFTATVSKCVPNQRIVIVLGDQRVETTCDPVTLQATVSLTAPPGLGTFTVSAEFYGDCSSFVQGSRSNGVSAQADVQPCLVLTQSIEVIAAGPTTTAVPDGNIPTTGSSGVSSTLTAALVLVAAGVGLFVVARLRRRPAG